MVHKIISKTKERLNQIMLEKYIKNLPNRWAELRKKQKIRVVFVLHEIAMWKTEELYLAMLEHPRFEPVIVPIISNEELPSSAIKKFNHLIEYLKTKKYNYIEVREIISLQPDLIIYGKTYDVVYGARILPNYNAQMTIYCDYSFNSFKNGLINQAIPNFASAFFVENELAKINYSRFLDNKGKNIQVTGVPMIDRLLKDKNQFNNPWKQQCALKKKIIWAPHFTFQKGISCLNLSSFLILKDFMLEMADKYREEIQIAFKPHPILYPSMVTEFGEEETKRYYNDWEKRENTQCETGEYVSLFKHSDAMIHDSASFLVEYLYINKPVLYTLNKDCENNFNENAQLALENVYRGNTKEEVESFIKMVISGEDPMKEKRGDYIKENLLPPNGKTACQNIIDFILEGEN